MALISSKGKHQNYYSTSMAFVLESQDVDFQNILVSPENYFIGRDEAESYFLFSYLRKYRVEEYGNFPRFHVSSDCEIIQKYQNFTQSNQMPVDITCVDTQEVHKDINLVMCKFCSGILFAGEIGIESDLEWYDAILRCAETTNLTIKNSSGYLSFWPQVSTAYREKAGWKCEKCGINLQNGRSHLHVHHQNGNKMDNRIDNLQSLCILCHAGEHMEKFESGQSFNEVMDFIEKYDETVAKCNPRLRQWSLGVIQSQSSHFWKL